VDRVDCQQISARGGQLRQDRHVAGGVAGRLQQGETAGDLVVAVDQVVLEPGAVAGELRDATGDAGVPALAAPGVRVAVDQDVHASEVGGIAGVVVVRVGEHQQVDVVDRQVQLGEPVLRVVL